jgi:hypothetical protein
MSDRTTIKGIRVKPKAVNANLLVLGEGPVAKAIATILNGILVKREPNDVGWNWPKQRSKMVFSLVLVAPREASASQMVRWHAEARGCPWIQEARLVMAGLDEQLRDELLSRDVFGGSARSKETFARWKDYIAISLVSDGLAGLLKGLATTKILLLDGWKREEELNSILPELMRILEAKHSSDLKKILKKLHSQDWDAFRTHEHVKRIQRWLAGVTDGVTPSWEEGKALFRPLTQSRK